MVKWRQTGLRWRRWAGRERELAFRLSTALSRCCQSTEEEWSAFLISLTVVRPTSLYFHWWRAGKKLQQRQGVLGTIVSEIYFYYLDIHVNVAKRFHFVTLRRVLKSKLKANVTQARWLFPLRSDITFFKALTLLKYNLTQPFLTQLLLQMRECNVISELGLKFMLYLQKTTGMDLFKGVKTL